MRTSEHMVVFDDGCNAFLVTINYDLHLPIERRVSLRLVNSRWDLKYYGVNSADPVWRDPQMGRFYALGTDNRKVVLYPSSSRPSVAERDVPAPKVRNGLDLRWRYGRWWKRTKRKGWVPVG